MRFSLFLLKFLNAVETPNLIAFYWSIILSLNIPEVYVISWYDSEMQFLTFWYVLAEF